MSSVWDSKAAHAVSVPPLLQRAGNTHFSCCIDRAKSGRGAADGLKSTYCKVSLEGFGAPVVVVATDLTVVVDVQPVELIEPVRDRLEGIKESV